MIGIYKFTSKITGLSYIGQSIHIEKRYNEHLIETLDKNKNTKWHQALREQGIENFEFSILEECLPEELNKKEIYWISYFNSYNNGYNSTPGGNSKYYNPQPIFDAWDKGLSISQICEKLKLGHSCVKYNLNNYCNYSVQESNCRGGKLAVSSNLKTFYVYQYDLNGNFIKQWNSCKEIARTLHYDASLIGKVINKKRKTAYGFLWTKYYADKIIPYSNE